MKRLTKAKTKMAFLKARNGIVKAEAAPIKQAPSPIGELNELLEGPAGVGFPYGKVSLVYGDPSSGKTTLAVGTIVTEMQHDPDHVCLLIPAERSEDLSYYEQLGLDLERCAVMEHDVFFLENVFEEIEEILESGAVDSILLDSWDGMLSKKQMYNKDGNKKAMDEETVGTKAAAGSRLWPRIKGLIGKQNVLFIAIAQVRTSGIGTSVTFKTMSGGHCLIHNAQVIVQMEVKGLVTETGATSPVGHEVKLTLKKTKINKRAHQYHTVVYNYENSWDDLQGLWVMALSCGAMIKEGGGYYVCSIMPPAGKKQETKIRGEKNAREFFRVAENRTALEALVASIQSGKKISDGVDECLDTPAPKDIPGELEDAFTTP